MKTKKLKTKTEKIKHPKLKTEKKKALDLFSKYIRTRDMLMSVDSSVPPGFVKCVTCEKPYPAFGIGCVQAGHFIPGRHMPLLLDERNAHAQCYNCNVNLKGNWPRYEVFMFKRYGRTVVEELKSLVEVKEYPMAIQYIDLQAKFKKKLEELT